MLRVAFLGPLGTFTQEALTLYYRRHNEAVETVSCSTVLEIMTQVKEGLVEAGVVPLENSIEGTVNLTLDLLTREEDLVMVGEVILPVRHFLLVPAEAGGQPPDLKRIQEVWSHPQALAQCQGFLRQNLPQARLVPTNSTAEAAALVAQRWTASGQNDLGPGLFPAAIATETAAQIYGLAVWARDIQDFESNETRFAVVARRGKGDEAVLLAGAASNPALPARPGSYKTSLAFSLPGDRPGGLYETLGIFAVLGINLTRIESRPAKTGLGKYYFYIDLEGWVGEEKVRVAIGRLKEKTSYLRIIGSYPAWEASR